MKVEAIKRKRHLSKLIEKIMKDIRGPIFGGLPITTCREMEKVLTKHLGGAKPEECDHEKVCPACYGKGKYSVYEGAKVACADFPGDKSYVVEQEGIKEYPCPKCKGAKPEPISRLPNCPNCGVQLPHEPYGMPPSEVLGEDLMKARSKPEPKEKKRIELGEMYVGGGITI